MRQTFPSLSLALLLLALPVRAELAPPNVGGQIRLRAEYRDPFGYVPIAPAEGSNAAPAIPEDASNTYLSRVRLNVSGDLAENKASYFLQLQDYRWFGEAGPADDLQGVDLHQGYLDLKQFAGDSVSLRLGRMALSYGDQRLISPLDWHPVGRAWDGALIRYAKEGYALDIFSVQNKRAVGQTIDYAETFTGIYDSWKASENTTLEAYVLWNRKGTLEDRYSLGAHAKGKAGSLGYNLEGVYQMGENSAGAEDMDIAAYGLVLGANIALGEAAGLALEVTHASGDDDPADDKLETFDPLFPFAHAYQGYEDIFAWRNGTDLMARLSYKIEKTTLALDGHYFLLATDKDKWYGATGAIRPSGGSTDVGQEVDAHVKHPLADAISLWAGVSYFMAGEVVEKTGGGDDMLWGFAQLTADF